MHRPRQLNGALVAVVIHVAAALFLFRLSLWTDEASSVFFARMSVWDLFTHLCDPHPPGYYVLLHFWMRVSDSEAWLRMLSLLASLGTLGVLYRWLKQWQGDHMARWVVIVLALQPMQIWYSAEVRMYATVQFLTILSAYLAWQLWEGRGSATRLAILYWLVASAALWTDYTSVFGLGMIQLFWIAYGWKLGWRWVALQIALGLPTALLWLTSGQLAALGSSYQPILIATRANQLGIDLTLAEAGSVFQIAVLMAAIIALGLALGWRTLVQKIGERPLKLAILAAWICILLIATLPSLFTVKRLFVVLLPWAALLSAWSLSTLPSKWSAFTQTLMLLATGMLLITHNKADWRQAIDLLPVHADAESLIWVDELAAPIFDYYGADLPWATLQFSSLPLFDTLPNRITLVSEVNRYRNVETLLPDAFYERYQLDQIDEVVFGVERLQFSFSEGATQPPISANADDWSAQFPSPLAACR